MKNLAMAYAMKKKMAKGGMCQHGSYGCPMCHGGKMAEGGMAHAEDQYDPVEHPEVMHNYAADMEDDEMINRIMMQKYSMGGKVANATPVTADFEDNEFDDLVKDDDLESSYTGADSGDEIGNKKMDEDDADLISRIMKSRMKKDKLPRPA